MNKIYLIVCSSIILSQFCFADPHSTNAMTNGNGEINTNNLLGKFSDQTFTNERIRIYTLSNVIDLAMRRSPELLQMQTDVKVAEAQLNQSLADLVLPSISLNGSFTLLDPETVSNGIISGQTPVAADPTTGQFIYYNYTLTNVYADNYSAGLSVSKPLFTGFKIWNTYQIKKLNLDLVKSKLEDKKQEIISTVQTSFYSLFLIKENFRITMDLDKSLSERRNNTSSNYHAGLVPQYDYIRDDVQLKNNQPKLLQAKNALYTSKMAFCDSLGIKDYDSVDFIGNLLDATNIQLDPIEETDAIKLALSNDINLKTLDNTIKTLKLSKDISDSGKFPTVVGVFNYQYDYTIANSSQTSRSFCPSWNIGIQLSYDIDSWLPFSKAANIVAETDENMKKTMLVRDQTIDGIVLQVRSLLLQVDVSKQTITVQSENVKEAKLGLDLVNTRYRQGNASSLDVTDAQVSLNQSEMNYLQAIYDYYSSVLQLKKKLRRIESI